MNTKQRLLNAISLVLSASYAFAAASPAVAASTLPLSYPVVDTGQTAFFRPLHFLNNSA